MINNQLITFTEQQNFNFKKHKHKINNNITFILKLFYQYNNPIIERSLYIESSRVAVIGGGIAGTVSALFLARQGLQVDLFEREKGIFMGSSAIPAHLYSGVQYFDDISKESIRHCMHDAIAFARTLPFIINPRPTIMALAKKDIRRPEALEEACIMNRKVYTEACRKDPKNRVFGNPLHFYKKYSRADVEKILKGEKGNNQSARWVAGFAKNTNLDDLQFPIFLIQEFGLDMRHAAGFMEQLIRENPNVRLHLSATVTKVKQVVRGTELTTISPKGDFKGHYHVVVDASGRNLGALESQLNVRNPRMVDVKLAGLFKLPRNHNVDMHVPEIYILGGKGHPAGTSFMSHVSPINPGMKDVERWMVINVTTPNSTYVADGKKSNNGSGAVNINAKDNPQAVQVLRDSNSHFHRLVNMVNLLKQRHRSIADQLQPVCGIPGSVDILGGNIAGRDSGIDAHPSKRFISLNLTKAGAAVGIARALLSELQNNGRAYDIRLESVLQNQPLLPKDIVSALKLTGERYSSLGFTKESSRTYTTAT